MPKVQVCSKCKRPRKGHPLPVGKNCKLEPLTSVQEQEIFKDVQQEDIEMITEEAATPPEGAEEIRVEIERMRLEKEKSGKACKRDRNRGEKSRRRGIKKAVGKDEARNGSNVGCIRSPASTSH